MATVHNEFFWSSFQQRAYCKACPDLFLDSGRPSKLLALQENVSVANSPALSESSAATKVEDEKTGLFKSQNTAKINLQNVCIENDEDFDRYLRSTTGHRKFIIQHIDHSWSRLNITKSLFDYLCFHMQTSDALKYMITYFGEKRRCDEIAPPLPLYQTSFGEESSRTLESCYILRYIALNQNDDPENPWSLRQFAVHAKQSDTDYSSWLLIAPPEAVIPDITRSSSPIVGNMSIDFTAHMFLIEHAVACWRPYLYYLTEEVDKCNEKLEFAAPPAMIKIDLAVLRLRLKNLEDQVEDAKISLQSNKAVIRTVQQLWTKTNLAHQKSRINSSENELNIKEKCSNYLLVVEALTCQLQSLRNKILSCTQITSSFSELSNGQALQGLAKSANSDAQRAASDAAAMKALTVIASIFLPTTVVLNFFSASFIDISGNKMHLADKWWLFAAISAPLTLSTLIIWTLWMQYQRWKSKKARDSSEQEQDPANSV